MNYAREWNGARCRIMTRGALGGVAIQLETGDVIVTEANQLRRASSRRQIIRDEVSAKLLELALRFGWDEEDLLYAGWERLLIPDVASIDQLSEPQKMTLAEMLSQERPPIRGQ